MPVIVIRFGNELPIGLESQHLQSLIPSMEMVSADLAIASEAFTITWYLYQVDSASPQDVYFLTSNHLNAGLALVDSAQASESMLTIQLPSDAGTASDGSIQYILNSELPIARDSDLRYFFGPDTSQESEAYYLTNYLITASLAVVELAQAFESVLVIQLPSDAGTASENTLRVFLGDDFAIELDTQYLSSSLIDVSLGIVDSAIASESYLTIISASDLGYECDFPAFTFIIPPPSVTTVTDIYWSLLQIFINSKLFQQCDLVIEPDSLEKYPTTSPPFLLLEPRDTQDISYAVGGGRWAKVYQVNLIAHIVIENISDPAYKDTNLMISTLPRSGPVTLADLTSNILEQSYPINQLGIPTTIELPYIESIDPPKRFGKSNEYLDICINFRCTFQQNLPFNMLATAGLTNVVSGTVNVIYNSTFLLTSSPNSGLTVGVQIYIYGDQSGGLYTVTEGSDNDWTISPAYGGLTTYGLTANMFIPLTDIYYSILQTVKGANLFIQTDYAIDPDDEYKYPTTSYPFCLLQPNPARDTGFAIGGGRYEKVYELEITAHIIVGNIFDQAWKDTQLIESTNLKFGPYGIVDQLCNLLEQSWPVNALGIPTLIELSYVDSIQAPKRYGKSNQYVGIPVNFHVTFRQGMYSILP